MSKFGDFLRSTFKKTNRFHVRSEPIGDSRDIVELFDRFLDGKLNYDMEWDDFISWENENTQAELVRLRLEKFEYLLNQRTMNDYRSRLLKERNHLASNLGMNLRKVANL